MDNCKQFVSTLNLDTPHSDSHIRHSPRYSGCDGNDHAHEEPFVAMSRMSSVQKPGSSIYKRVTSTFNTFFLIFHPYQYISQTVAANYTVVKRK